MTGLRRVGQRLARILGSSLELMAAHRLRTALSVSGLFVGVATVMVMVAFGKGAERRIADRVRAMGSDVVIVTSPPASRVAGRERQVSTVTALRPSDAEAVALESSAARGAAPVVSRMLLAKWGDRNANVLVVGTTEEGVRIRRMAARTGRVFDDTDDREQRRVVLLGPTAARLLFVDTDPVGREIRLGTVPFEVIGVMSPRGTDVGGTDLDNEVIVPLQTAMRRLLNVPYVHAIIAQASSADALDQLEADTREILRRRHPTRAGEGGVEAFVIQNQAVVLRTQRGTARALNGMIVAVAALALLVGGVGIAAVMQLSVRERVREIGLRRAVGARRRDIRLQFLMEAAVLAVAGGATGIVGGLVVSAAAAALSGWDLVFSWWAALLGLAASTILGVLAGVLPATRAVRLEPVAALRAV